MITQNSVYGRLVKEIMNRDVVTINAAETIHDALKLMEQNRVSTLPVVDNDDHCVGILSSTDLVDMTRDVDDDIYELSDADASNSRFILDKLIHSMGGESIQSFMSEKVETVHAGTSIGVATKKMVRAKIHHLPVVDDQDRLVGIVSTMDVLAEFADACPE
jgi:CBS domain-containing protein